MAGRIFNLVQELSNLLGEIPEIRRKLEGSRSLGKQFREVHARYDEAVREYHEAHPRPLPEEQSARQKEEARRSRLAADFQKRTQENEDQWIRYTESLAFMNPFLATLELLCQRLPLTPAWQAYAGEIRRLQPGISQLGSWHEGITNYDLDTLEFRLLEMLNRARDGSNAVDCQATQPVVHGVPAPEVPSREPVTTPAAAAPSESTLALRAESQAPRAKIRRAVVMPILDQKRWRRGRWATEAGVGKNGVYEYLAGKRNLTNENRRALAEVLGLKPEDLPQ